MGSCNENCTGLAQIVGQLQGSNRDFSQSVGPSLTIWADPVRLWVAAGIHTTMACAGQWTASRRLKPGIHGVDPEPGPTLRLL
jgi:hypothetical protein